MIGSFFTLNRSGGRIRFVCRWLYASIEFIVCNAKHLELLGKPITLLIRSLRALFIYVVATGVARCLFIFIASHGVQEGEDNVLIGEKKKKRVTCWTYDAISICLELVYHSVIVIIYVFCTLENEDFISAVEKLFVFRVIKQPRRVNCRWLRANSDSYSRTDPSLAGRNSCTWPCWGYGASTRGRVGFLRLETWWRRRRW